MASSPERPVPPGLPTVEQVPAELRGLRRWVGWRAVFDENKTKWRKPPHSPVTGEPIGAVEKWAEHWLTFEQALAGVIKHKLDGIGFVFRDGDGYVGIDFDDCRKDGQNHEVVSSWLKWLPTYAEVSPSGTGVHAIGRAKITRSLTATALPNTDEAKVEIYNQGRYFTFTGQRVSKIIDIGDFQLGVDKLLQYLGDKEIGQPGTEQSGVRPMSVLTARRIHKDNLNALRNAMQGEGNALLNAAAFFAGRAFAAKALDQDEAVVKAELLRIVTEEWDKPHPEHGARGTIESGWASGVEQPIKIIDDPCPEVTELIEDFNKRFYVVEDFGNKCRVCWETPSAHIKGNSIVLGAQSFNDFRNRFINDKIVVGDDEKTGQQIYKSKGDVWLENKHRNQYEQVTFAPGTVTSARIRNLWRGFAFDAKKGQCQRYLTHIHENVCQANKEKYDYIMGWMAYAVRNPGEQGHVALVVQGKKGVGKNVFAENFAALWGTHSVIISSDHGVTTNFNAHLRDKCVLIADEAFFAGDPRQDRVLKSMVTGKELMIEAKGVDKIVAPNFLHFIIIGNDDRLVNATDDERRYFAVRCGDSHKDDHGYFHAINRELSNGGYSALLYHLLYEVDLTKFNVRHVPRTEELTNQILDSLRGFESAWAYCLYTGQVPGRPQANGTIKIRIVEMVEWCGAQKNMNQRWGRITPQNVGRTLCSNGNGDRPAFNFDKHQQKDLLNKGRTQYLTIPPLKECRELWNQLRFKLDWNNPDEQWDTIDMQP